jgi:hypothetical protein
LPQAGGIAITDNPKAGTLRNDRPRWTVRFKEWLRMVRENDHPTRADMISHEFLFLEGQYGFRRVKVVDMTMFTTVTWMTEKTTVCVELDAREGMFVAIGSREPRSGRHEYDLFHIKLYRKQGTLADIRAALKAKKRPRGYREELEQLAVDLQTYASDMLRGDFALFDGLDEEYRKLQ